MPIQQQPVGRSTTSLLASGVLAGDVDRIWPLVRGYLLNAIEYADGKYTEESVLESIRNRQMQLWVAGETEVLVACVTTICDYPGKKVCNLMFVGGKDMNEWKHSLSLIEEWAKSLGCDSLEVWGRKGWERILSDYDVIHTVIRKSL